MKPVLVRLGLVLLSTCLTVASKDIQAKDIQAKDIQANDIEFFDSIKAASDSAEKAAPTVVYFGAEWCASCSKLKATTFKEVEKEDAEKYHWVAYDIDNSTDVAKEFQVTAVPKIVVLDTEGEVIGEHVGMISADKLLEFIADVIDHPQTPLPSLEELVEVFQSSDDESIPAAVDLIVEQLANVKREDREMILEFMADSERDCSRELIRVMRSNRLAIRAAALQTLGSVSKMEIKFDPFADVKVRNQQIKRIEEQLGLN